MDFRPDNVADVLGLLLGLLLLAMSYIFYRRMQKQGAEAWADAGYSIALAAGFFTLGMVVTLSTVFFSDNFSREALNLAGNTLWVIAAYFAYKMLKTLVNVLGVMLGA